jgi:glycerol kinase
MSYLVLDIGTTNLRCVIVRPDGTLVGERRTATPPTSPFTGAVEFDPVLLATTATALANATLAEHGPVRGVGITTQRASTVVWDRTTGVPVAKGIGWQDLRTAGMCVMAGAMGTNISPNQSATKAQFLLDSYDPDRQRDLCFGTVDSWIIWTLTTGAEHVIEATNAAVTGLIDITTDGEVVWDHHKCEFFRIPPASLPRIVPSIGVVGRATALHGAPPILGVAGDQQSSLVGQACVKPGDAKITFGTGAMLDIVVGTKRPTALARSAGGTFPIVAWAQQGQTMFGLEAIALSAGSCVSWLVDDMALLDSPLSSAEVAAQCATTDGVRFVPALLGLGTPMWDYGARGTLLGLTRGTGRPEIVRAVLEGVAMRGADLVDAAEADTKHSIRALRIDGGMSANAIFVQALADATQRTIETSPVLEATALGAGYLAGLADGSWTWDDLATLWNPSMVTTPSPPSADFRQRWHDALRRSREWHPDLSALTF